MPSAGNVRWCFDGNPEFRNFFEALHIAVFTVKYGVLIRLIVVVVVV
jgi:hypothetical protein